MDTPCASWPPVARLAPADGRLFVLGTATLCILGYERETAAMLRWNEPLEEMASARAGG